MEEVVLERMRALSPEEQQRVLAFIESLAARRPANDETAARENVFDFIARLPPGMRSKEEIDAQLKEERDSWGER